MKQIKTLSAMGTSAIVVVSTERPHEEPGLRFEVIRERWYRLTPASFRRIMRLCETDNGAYSIGSPQKTYSRDYHITRERRG